MKKKTVVKKEAREKRTHDRTPVRFYKPVPIKENNVTVPVESSVEENEPVKKQHNRKPKPVEVVETVNDTENNEQNI